MSQSNPDFELTEVVLMPPDESPVTRDLPTHIPGPPASAVAWPALQEFDEWRDAYEWAFYQTLAGGPKYYIHLLDTGKWEAIQAWMRNL